MQEPKEVLTLWKCKMTVHRKMDGLEKGIADIVATLPRIFHSLLQLQKWEFKQGTLVVEE